MEKEIHPDVRSNPRVPLRVDQSRARWRHRDAGDYGNVAIVTARNNARGTYRGRPVPKALRATLVLSDSGLIRLAANHMSFIADTKGSPPVPGQTDSGKTHAAANADREGR